MDSDQAVDESLDPNAEKAIDAVLAEIMGPDDDDEQPEETQEVEEEVEEEDTEEASSEPAAQEIDPEWKSARDKLQLAGFSKAYLESLGREQTISEWSQRSPREQEIQRAFRERAELQKRIEELEATTKRAEHGEPTAREDLNALEQRAIDELGDLGKDLVAALRENQAPQAPQELQEQLAASTAMLEELIRERAQAGLGKRFPTLRKDREVYEKVERLAGQLGATDMHKDVVGVARYEALMESAAKLLGIDATDPEAERQEQEKKEAARRAKGTPTRGGKTAPVKDRAPGEILDAKIRYIQSNPNATAEDVRKQFGG